MEINLLALTDDRSGHCSGILQRNDKICNKMINELITYLDSKISGTNLIDRWGGYCELFKTRKTFLMVSDWKVIAKVTYTYDDRNESCSVLILKICNV